MKWPHAELCAMDKNMMKSSSFVSWSSIASALLCCQKAGELCILDGFRLHFGIRKLHDSVKIWTGYSIVLASRAH